MIYAAITREEGKNTHPEMVFSIFKKENHVDILDNKMWIECPNFGPPPKPFVTIDGDLNN